MWLIVVLTTALPKDYLYFLNDIIEHTILFYEKFINKKLIELEKRSSFNDCNKHTVIIEAISDNLNAKYSIQ